ncbi:uroporphyrinogen-III synthase [Falsihalocynthiibacter sp. SS001]|uniref:uroporphyrinogen-III synthase n=1 Tax=Falsihalocynthiibacter sp. SS001 TaxID=3349698 RepID=UPI0036D36F72
MSSQAPILLLTRPLGAAEDFVKRLKMPTDAQFILAPLMRIETLSAPQEFEAAVLTSRNGVVSEGVGRVAYCVGARTAERAIEQGYEVRHTALDAERLVAWLVSNPPENDLLHMRGEYARGEIAKRLSDAGIRCDEQIVYRQVATPLTQEAFEVLRRDQDVLIPLFSPRSATLFVEECTRLGLDLRENKHAKIIALSQDVAHCIPKQLSANIVVCSEPSGDKMLQIVQGFFKD